MALLDARFYKTILISPSRQTTAEILPLLSQGLPLAPVQHLDSYPSRRQILDLLTSFDAKLCFLEFAPKDPQALQALDDLHAIAPQVPVVVLLPGNNPDAIMHCLRQGATDVLVKPFTADQMDGAIEKTTRLLPPPQRAGANSKTIAVVPARGACGATTVACNVAYQAKREGAQKVLLADMDPIAGTVSFLLKLKSGYSFMDVLGRANSLDGDLWKQTVVQVGGIDVLLAPDTPVDPMELTTAMPIVTFAQEAYEAVVLDCGGAYTGWDLSVVRAADEILLVSTNELSSLQSAQRAVAFWEQSRVDTGKIRLVLNRYVKDIGLATEAVAEGIGLEPFQTIPNDVEAVQKSLMEGKAIAAGTAAGKTLTTLSGRLFDFRTSAKGKTKGSPKSGRLLSSLFSR